MERELKDYKDTLLLPRTNFPMRGNLPQNEPKRYESWFGKRNVYGKMKARKSDLSFTLHDGPPYANGHIHIGHALNKILKDIIVKTHYFLGEEVRYVPGWDCHGLPIEQQVEKAIGKEKKDALPKSKIRELCRKHALKFIDIQRDEFKSLGVVGDWDNPYLTLKYQFEADIYRSLCEVAKKGLLVERSKPVFWSWAAKSALAEAEVEYKDKEDYSIFVAFKLDLDAKEKLGISEDVRAVIWTTTPWTLPANMAIAFNKDEDYVLTEDNLIFAKALLENAVELGITNGKIKKTFKAKILEKTHAINPLNGIKSTLILGDHVMMDGGSGLVHTAPGHGEDDYYVCLKYGIDVVMPVDDEGKYDQTLVREKLLPAEFVGQHVLSVADGIFEILGENLLYQSRFTHSYPFCWRTHKPVIYRATKQWFIAMDEEKLEGKTLRQRASEEISKINFYPSSGIKRLSSMIENRPDWCISRQRDWGVPIAFFRDKTTGKVLLDEDLLDHIIKLFEENGADIWWDKDIKDLLPRGSKLDPENLEKVMDILDVWFDSGSTWNAVLKSGEYDAGEYPASMYLEGSDQHRGWFQSSLLVSTSCENKAPYKNILTHGFTVDEKGEKMSKSKGNVVAPSDVAKKYGVEILRLWVGVSDYTTELKISDTILKQASEQYRKIRNTFRFLLAGCDGLDEVLSVDKLQELDKWILGEAREVFDEVEGLFRKNDFAKAYALLSHFIAVELSGIYLDITKDRLYCDDEKSEARISTQSAYAHIAKSLMPLLAPVLTYTIDEICEYAPKSILGDAKDVFDLSYEPIKKATCKNDWAYMKEVREKFFEIIDPLKKDKKISSTLELILSTNSKKVLEIDKTNASDWFTISGVESLKDGESLGEFELDGDKFKIIKSSQSKCPRCWKFLAPKENKVCPRCQEVLSKNV
ncbi:MAG: isoleucine--tRNA ligase [Proteobacteria bacterium]|nr:MAG: isoleucine--tRNA ligase [Pseudomonadota bacterium]